MTSLKIRQASCTLLPDKPGYKNQFKVAVNKEFKIKSLYAA